MTERGLLLGYMFYYFSERNDLSTVVVTAHDKATADKLLKEKYPEINPPPEAICEEIREGVIKGPCR